VVLAVHYILVVRAVHYILVVGRKVHLDEVMRLVRLLTCFHLNLGVVPLLLPMHRFEFDKSVKSVKFEVI